MSETPTIEVKIYLEKSRIYSDFLKACESQSEDGKLHYVNMTHEGVAAINW